jgi:hypothetical protein
LVFFSTSFIPNSILSVLTFSSALHPLLGFCYHFSL